MTNPVNKPKENPETFSVRNNYTAQVGDDTPQVASKLGIRLTGMPPDIGTTQVGDVFDLSLGSKGNAVLKKKRPETTPGTKFEKSFPIEISKVFKDIEQGPAGFPYIRFKRNPENDTYTILDKASGETGLTVKTVNLDEFKSRLQKISGVLITECGARKELYELSCNVKQRSNSEFALNSSWGGLFDRGIIDIKPLTALVKLSDKAGGSDISNNIINTLVYSIPLNIRTEIAKK